MGYDIGGLAMTDTLGQLLQKKLVIIARGIPAEPLADAAQALYEAGIRFLEVTVDHLADDPVADYQKKATLLFVRMGGRMHIGAGTVLSVKEVQAAADCGCEYILSPGTSKQVVAETKRLRMLSIPGTMTPTEIMQAWELGADMVKVFPADDLGMHFFKNLNGPLPHIPLMVTGGVNPQTIPEFLLHGVKAVATGITVLPRELAIGGDFAGIKARAIAHISAVESVAV